MKRIIDWISLQKRKYQTRRLLKELRRFPFIWTGYQESGVRILGRRFLEEWEVKIVKKLSSDGKLISVGINTITSRHGSVYTDEIFLLVE